MINEQISEFSQPDAEREYEEFDREAFLALAEEFGGLAGSTCKKLNNGDWTQDGWDKLMIRLYKNRDLLEGVDDQRARGLVVLRAFEGNPYEAMLERIEKQIRK